MNETIFHVVIGVIAGFAVGLAFFRLLWWSTERAVSSEHPVAVVTASFVGRSIIMVGFFALAIWLSPVAGICAAVGFLLARRVAVRGARKELPCD